MCAGAAHAIGDSGGCQTTWGPVQEALAFGSVADLERVLEENHRQQPESKRPADNVASRPYAHAGCAGVMDVTSLLYVAALHGNMDTTKYLLDKGGQPSLPMFQQCSAPVKTTPGIGERRKATFKLMLQRSGLVSRREILECKDLEMLKVYVEAGARAEPGDVGNTLGRIVGTYRSSNPYAVKEIDRAGIFLQEGGLIREERVLLKFTSLCAAPTTSNVEGCKALAAAAKADPVALALGNQRALDQLLVTCSTPYVEHVFPDDGTQDCRALQSIAPLRYDVFKAAVQHADAGRLDQYDKAVRALWPQLNLEPRYGQYKSAVLFHLGRSAGLTCRADAEELLKRALDFQRDRENQYNAEETKKRLYELGYFYFDKRQYQQALPLLQQFEYRSPAMFLDLRWTVQFHRDLAQVQEALGDAKKAALSRKGADDIATRIRPGDAHFQRQRYPAAGCTPGASS